MEVRGKAGQVTDDNTAHAFACWITKATETTQEYVILITFRQKKMVTRTPLDVRLYINDLSCYCLKKIKTDKNSFFFFLLFYSVI